MYYVRKLSKPPNLYKIQQASDVSLIPADFLGQEMRTSGNTLSVWRCESLNTEDSMNAIKAALFASSEITATQFIILDSEMLEAAGIKTNDVLGKTSYIGLNELHTDLCDLTYEKIGILLNLYHQVSTSQDRIPKIEKKDFQRLALEAYSEGCLDENAMNDQFKKAMEKLLSKPKAS